MKCRLFSINFILEKRGNRMHQNICIAILVSYVALLNAIKRSGYDDMWIKAGWFGRNTQKQVLGCTKMRRALETHENTLVSLYVYLS